MKVGVEYILYDRYGASLCPLTVKVLRKEAETSLWYEKMSITAYLSGRIVMIKAEFPYL
ncbi:hypothetical protein [Candidatus Endomicrobiellum trichonymphae]|uniref:hypothetical protein n=1 Tax=Endomicrobium trichonymphae TaxID=1408204 RepID=UPI00130542D8|nr:hypothetical protein [Candidatus Endomicrobium trichonymphae]